ncbi:phosphoribosyltransferase [Candidatus Uhrbacteria bacterium]|nr:phosphoribosyltransferase [Candidatus Uhrbacteria bacterium]
MTQQEIEKIFEEVGAVITNSHIVYTSGKHGTAYINKDAVYPHTEKISALCGEIADRFVSEKPEAVVAPALGGIILSQWIAHHLTEKLGYPVYGVYAEKTDSDGFVIKRGYDELIRGKKVLLAEDVLTTGGSIKKVVEVTRAIGATILGVVALCNRGDISTADIGNVPRLDALLNISLDSWDETDCPMCAQGVPINTAVGKGKEFLAKKQVS